MNGIAVQFLGHHRLQRDNAVLRAMRPPGDTLKELTTDQFQRVRLTRAGTPVHHPTQWLRPGTGFCQQLCADLLRNALTQFGLFAVAWAVGNRAAPSVDCRQGVLQPAGPSRHARL